MSLKICGWCSGVVNQKTERCDDCHRNYRDAPVELMGQKFHPGFLKCHLGLKAALETGEIEGVKFRLLDGEIEPGDTYIAERNVGLQLLTCKENVKHPMWGGWIQPVEPKYPYDTGECIRIELILD